MLPIERIIAACRPPQSHVNPADMERIGIQRICRAAQAYNILRRGGELRERRRIYREQPGLFSAPDAPPTPTVMTDGWALDTSRSLPHLDALLADADTYIAERAHTNRGMSGREFIRDLFRQEDLPRFPSFLNFVTSPAVLATVSRYLGFIPVLSTTVPPGIRFVESDADGQLRPGEYQQSQLYHLDLHDRPLVYVIVLLRDVTAASGPFTFLPAAASDRAARALRYGRSGREYRVTDDRMYAVVDRSEARELIYPRGTVLFIDTSRCFHFGSRDAVVTRYQMMYTFVSPCRTDFTESFMTPRIFPREAGDSLLRRLAMGPRPWSFQNTKSTKV